jgi:hypothetical protein
MKSAACSRSVRAQDRRANAFDLGQRLRWGQHGTGACDQTPGGSSSATAARRTTLAPATRTGGRAANTHARAATADAAAVPVALLVARLEQLP